MTLPHQAPGQWDAGEGDWIDRVLDRAIERIEDDELFSSQPVEVGVGDTAVVGDQAQDQSSSPRLSGQISAGEFATASGVRVGVGGPRTPEAAVHRPALDLGERPPLSDEMIGRSARIEELSPDARDSAGTADELSWFDRDDDDRDDGFEALSAPRERSAARGMLQEWAPVLVLAVVVAVVFRMFLFTAYHIPSLSMAPALDVGDRVVVNRLSYQLGDLDRGQVVVFSRPPGQLGQADHLIKRVVGLPGETVTVAEGHIWIDGRRLDEPYLAQEASSEPRVAAIPGCDSGGSRTECVVPAGKVFVMGDNRRGSVDSRVFGPIEQDSIVGRAFVRIWVLDHIGWL